MAETTRISQLSSLNDPSNQDVLIINDISDQTQSAEGSTKRVTVGSLMELSVDARVTQSQNNWNTTYTTTNQNSANWDTAYATVTGLTGTQGTQGTQGTSYTDNDVDTHLNTSGATDGQVLSYTSGDYAWVNQSTGGGSSGGSSSGGTSPAYTTVQATSAVVSSTTMNVVDIPLNGSTDKFKVVEKTGDGTKWRLNFTGGTTGEYYSFQIAWDNIYPRGYGSSYEFYDDAVQPTAPYFETGWGGDYTIPTMVLEKKLEYFRPMYFNGPTVNITHAHLSKQPYKMTLQCNLNVASGSTVTTDSNGKKWLTNSGAYSSTGTGWLWNLAINGYVLDADPLATPAGDIMRYIYAYDDGAGGPMLKYWDENFNFAELDVANDLTVLSEGTFGNDTVVTEATWWDTDFIYMIMENTDNKKNINNSGHYEGRNQFLSNIT